MTKSFGAILGRQLRTSAGKSDSRVKLIRAVRAAARRLDLDDDDRRDIQVEVTGKRSMADMTIAELGNMLDRLNRDRPAPMAHRAHVGKIKALWWSLYWLGAIEEPSDRALDAFVKRQTGLSTLRFVDHRRAPSLIEAMKAMAAREGVLWKGEVAVRELSEQLGRPIDQARVDRAAVLDAIWDRLCKVGAVSGNSPTRYVRQLLGGVEGDSWSWSAHAVDIAIRQLGKQLRRALDTRDAG